MHKQEVKNLCKTIIENGYAKFADIMFIQKRGVPMGMSASCLLADLTLSYDEYIYMQYRDNGKYTQFRYVDDKIYLGTQAKPNSPYNGPRQHPQELILN